MPRPAIAMWLLLLWLLGGLVGQALPSAWDSAPHAGPASLHWHGGVAPQRERMDLVAERLPAQRAGSRAAHDALPATASALLPHSPAPRPVPAAAPGTHAAPAASPYSARAPPAGG